MFYLIKQDIKTFLPSFKVFVKINISLDTVTQTSILIIKTQIKHTYRTLMQKSKKQKQQRQLRQSLKTYLNLTNHLYSPQKPSLLSKIYPQIASVNSLRIFAVLEVIYLLDLCTSILQKRSPYYIGDFRIGIIGGGITARLILHSLLPLSKDGLNLRNITISTRQTQNFTTYAQNFGVKVVFDNETTAIQADFLIVCAPATLDNWIIADLKEPLRIRSSGQEKSQNKAASNIVKLTAEKSQISNGGPSAFSAQSAQKAPNLQISGSLQMPRTSQKFMKPLVYILTSDFTEQKCSRFFDFPVLTPSIRAKDLKDTTEKFQTYKAQTDTIQLHEKVLSWWLTRVENVQRKIESRQGNHELVSYESADLQAKINKFIGTPFLKILIALNHTFGSPLSISSLGSSLSITISVSQSVQAKNKDQTMLQIIETATLSGQIDETFLKKIKKWRMVHNNFIA